MAREKLPTSPLTKQALEGIVKQVSAQMEKSDDYLYAILAGHKPDCYPYFRQVFRATAYVDVSRADLWLEDLKAIREAAMVREVGKGKPLDHGFVVDCLLEVLRLPAMGAPDEERLKAMRKAHSTLGLYIRSVEAQADAPADETHGGAVTPFGRATG